jgi:hypothetical protein
MLATLIVVAILGVVFVFSLALLFGLLTFIALFIIFSAWAHRNGHPRTIAIERDEPPPKSTIRE